MGGFEGAREYRAPLLEEVRISEVEHVVQEANASDVIAYIDAVQTRVLGQEEHLLAETQDLAHEGVDHTSVGKQEEILIGVFLQETFDDVMHTYPEPIPSFRAGRTVPDRLLVP